MAEGRLIRRLSHPHIVRGYEVVERPRPLVVMETLTGQILARLIENAPRRLPVREIGHLGLHLGSAIRYLHGEGWLHLDLKPGNVVAEAGRAKLIDMSVARRPGPAPPGVGTWCDMAPEQATGGTLGPPADVWGLGVVLYEATTGHAGVRPHRGRRVVLGVRHRRAPAPPARRPAAPGAAPAPGPAGAGRAHRRLHPPAPGAPAAGRPRLRALEPLAGLPPRERRFRR